MGKQTAPRRPQEAGAGYLEILMAIAITLIALGVTAPGVSQYYSRQQLKVVGAEIGALIISARSMSITTECDARVNLQPRAEGIDVEIALQRSQRWQGCMKWFEATGQASAQESAVLNTRINSAEVAQAMNLVFEGASGQLDSSTAVEIVLNRRGQSGKISLDGIGSGVFAYAP